MTQQVASYRVSCKLLSVLLAVFIELAQKVIWNHLFYVLCLSSNMYCVHHPICTVFIIQYVLCSSSNMYYVHHPICTVFIIQYVLCSSSNMYCVHHPICTVFIIQYVPCSSSNMYYVHHPILKIRMLSIRDRISPYPQTKRSTQLGPIG